MADSIVAMTQEQYSRILRAVKKIESMPVVKDLQTTPRTSVSQAVKVTDTTKNANGYYPGTWYKYHGDDATTLAIETVWVWIPNSWDPTTDVIYRGFLTGATSDGKAVFGVFDASGSVSYPRYVEYLSQSKDPHYIELHSAYSYTRNADADGSIEWLPTSAWAHMANKKTPQLGHLYPSFEVDNRLKVANKRIYTTEGTCCDDDAPDTNYSGYGDGDGNCPAGYCWDPVLRQCICCDPSCCDGCWDELNRRCYICCESGEFFNPDTGTCDPVDIATCSGTSIPAVLRCTVEWMSPGGSCVGITMPTLVFPLFWTDPEADIIHGYVGGVTSSDLHAAHLIKIPACVALQSPTVFDVPDFAPLVGYVGVGGPCPAANVTLSTSFTNQTARTYTSSPRSLVIEVGGLWRVTIDEYP